MPWNGHQARTGPSEYLRCSQVFPSLSKEGVPIRIRNRCVLIRSLNTDLVVLLRQELFYVYFLFSDPSLKNSFPLLPWDWLLALMKHNLLLHMMTLLLKCGLSYLYSPSNALANFFSRVSVPSISLSMQLFALWCGMRFCWYQSFNLVGFLRCLRYHAIVCVKWSRDGRTTVKYSIWS